MKRLLFRNYKTSLRAQAAHLSVIFANRQHVLAAGDLLAALEDSHNGCVHTLPNFLSDRHQHAECNGLTTLQVGHPDGGSRSESDGEVGNKPLTRRDVSRATNGSRRARSLYRLLAARVSRLSRADADCSSSPAIGRSCSSANIYLTRTRSDIQSRRTASLHSH